MLNPEMPDSELRLHMGELTANELRVARAAIQWANAKAWEWQPMETLPTNVNNDSGIAKSILIYNKKKKEIRMGWWSELCKCYKNGFNPITAKFTNWMPLPQPPKDGE